MTKEEPFSATFKLNKDTRNTIRYAEEAEERRPIVHAALKAGGWTQVTKPLTNPVRFTANGVTN